MEEPIQPPLQIPDQPVQPVPERSFPVWLPIVVGLVALTLGALIASVQLVQTLSRAAAPPAPTPLLTPTVSRSLSAIATDSAFLLLESSVGSLSASVSSLSTQDTTLTPPVLTLPLGFAQ